MNLLQIRSVMILMFSLIIFTGILFLWQALLLFSFFLSINLRKNIRFFLPIISLILRMLGWFWYFLIPQKTGSAIFGLVILSQRLLPELWFGTILLKLKRIISSKTRTLTVQCLSRNNRSNQRHFKGKTIWRTRFGVPLTTSLVQKTILLLQTLQQWTSSLSLQTNPFKKL